MMIEPVGLTAIDVETVAAATVGPGRLRRDLPSRAGMRVWLVAMAPGAECPHLDQHDAGDEDVFAPSGELIEGDRRGGPGTYLHFGSGSSHRPRTETGVRLFGINQRPPGERKAGND